VNVALVWLSNMSVKLVLSRWSEAQLSFGRGAGAFPSCIEHDSDGVRGMLKSHRYCWIDEGMGTAGRRHGLWPYCPQDGPSAGLSLLGTYQVWIETFSSSIKVWMSLNMSLVGLF